MERIGRTSGSVKCVAREVARDALPDLRKLLPARSPGWEEISLIGGVSRTKSPLSGEKSSRQRVQDLFSGPQGGCAQVALESAEISATISRSTGMARSAKPSSTRATGPETETAVRVGMSGTAMA